MQTQDKTKNLSLTLLLLAMLVLAPAAIAAAASISTDQEDYAPWEIVTINGSGFDPNSDITITIEWPDGYLDEFDATSDGSGGFTVWYGKEKYEGTFTVTATDGTNTATTTFTDATNYNTTITLDTLTSPLTTGQTGVSYQGRVFPNTAGNPQVPNGAPVTLECQSSGVSATTTTTSGNGTFSGTFTAPTVGGTYKFRASFDKFAQGSGGSAVSWNQSTSSWQTVVVNSPSDTTPPVITITVPADGGVYLLNQVVNANWSATDAESGIDSATGTTANGAAINTAAIGAETYTVTATNGVGLTATKTVSYTVEQPDITAPVVSITAPANGGYYKTSTLPALTYTVTDDTDPDPNVVETGWSTAEGVHTVTVTATDATGKAGWASVTYTVDNTAPVVTFAPPLSGWFKTSPVVSSVTATDSSSNITEIYLEDDSDGTLSDVVDLGTPSASGTLTVSGDGSYMVICSASDSAGNIGTGTAMFGIDNTPPVVAITAPVDGASYKSADVPAAAFTAVDNYDPSPVVVEAGYSIVEGVQTYTVTATDAAGNVGSAFVTYTVDNTPPIITAIRSPGSNANGWNNTNVTASYTASDALSGLDSPATGSYIFSTDGAGQSHTFTVSDKAGNNASATIDNVNIDKTAPVITITTPADKAEYLLNQVVYADWTAMDALSEIASVSGTVPSGSVIDTTLGAKTFAVTATDKAGNTGTASVTYYVRYSFGGILQPINADGTSIFKLGSTIPVKFQLRDAAGNFVLTAVAKIYLTKIGNGISGSELEAVSTSAATTGNLFRLADSQYIFNLSTKPLSVGTWQIRIELNDGTSQLVNISLRK